jgi:hypothetical protein
MGSVPIWHWLIVLTTLANAFFYFRIVWRMGFHPLWGLIAMIPVLNVVLFWFAAYKAWPEGSPRG